MKILTLIGIIFILTGCHNPECIPKQYFHLVDRDGDTLGVVSCVLPVEFDTRYKWTHHSDCSCCDAVKYRCHSSKYEIVQENGMGSIPLLETGFYFTISHSTYISCDTSTRFFYKGLEATSDARNKRFEQEIKELEELGGAKVLFDTGRIINENPYNIFYYIDKSYVKILENDSIIVKAPTFNMLGATTKYKDRRIGFSIQSNVHNRDSFYLLAMTILESIKIQ